MDPLSPLVTDGINFLAFLFKGGLGYSAICTARSAISGLVKFKDSECFGEHQLVRKFIKGVFELRPALPRYAVTWDVDIVFDFLKMWFPFEDLTLKELTLKAVALMAILSGQRCQTLVKFSLSSMKVYDTKCVFNIDSCVKQTRRGKHLAPVEFMCFPNDSSLCVVSVLKHYIERTKDLRKGTDQLLIAYQKPHKPVSTDTVGRWIRTILTQAGIDTEQFKAHSTRVASASAAVQRGAPVDAVLKAAGWAAESTFTKYYKKAPAANLGQILLDSFLKTQN